MTDPRIGEPTLPSEASLERETRACRRCGVAFEAQVLRTAVVGREQILFGQQLCEACVEVERAEERERERAAAEGARAARVEAHLRAVPARFAAAWCDEPAVVEWVEAWTDRRDVPEPSLVLLGPVGSGKSYQAWGAWRALAEARPALELVAWRVSQLLERLRAAEPEERAVILRACHDADLLLLEDLGVAKPTEWVQEQLLEIVDERYVRCLPILATTNLLPNEELDARIGERAASRLHEMGRFVGIEGAPSHPDRRRAR